MFSLLNVSCKHHLKELNDPLFLTFPLKKVNFLWLELSLKKCHFFLTKLIKKNVHRKKPNLKYDKWIA